MTTYIQQSSTGTHSLVQFKSIVLHVSTSPRNFDIYFGNIYKNLYFCQRSEFVVSVWIFWIVCFYKLCYINVQKCLSVCVCVILTPSHCYAFMFCAFYLPESKKNALDTYVTSHSLCVCVRVRACACAWYACSMLPFCSSISAFIYVWIFFRFMTVLLILFANLY